MDAKNTRYDRSRFVRQTSILIWKSYLQRQRRWRCLVIETLLAALLFISAIYVAKPVFLTPIRDKPTPPLPAKDIFNSISTNKIVGFAPNLPPYSDIMDKVAKLLKIKIIAAADEDGLNDMLYKISVTASLQGKPVIWIMWKPKDGNKWNFSIRSTERAQYAMGDLSALILDSHLGSGFLALQLAISRMILEYETNANLNYEMKLVAMPVSPLMQEHRVYRALSKILLCFTLAFIPPILDTQALVVHETVSRYKRALRMHGVDYSAMYIGWLAYAYLSAMPISLLASLTITFIFRWIHLIFAMLLVFVYVTIMMMLAFIMAMFQTKEWIACVWTTFFTLLQLYIAELLVHLRFTANENALAFILHLLIPPLGMVNTFHQFSLLQLERVSSMETRTILTTIGLWTALIGFYFILLMMLQRTIGNERAIGGQVSWSSIIFKKAENRDSLRPIQMLTGKEREKLQEVDEFVAKAISFRGVSKTVMGTELLKDVTLDIYRCEYSMIFLENMGKRVVFILEDLITGLSYPDKGVITVLGHPLKPGGPNFMNLPYMMGYCHRSELLIDDLTVEEHLSLFMDLCLWQESRHYIHEYFAVRVNQLLDECDLKEVRSHRIAHLDFYYKAQLCWAIAVLVEARVVVIPHFQSDPTYIAVMKDKIFKAKNKLSIIKMCFTTLQLESADRVFIFDSKLLVFGGTPAYLFFKYGREYRVRLTMRDGLDDSTIAALSDRVAVGGGSVRAHLGTMLILRVPAHPTETVAKLVDDLTKDSDMYGISSLYITVPDSDEVFNRAIFESRTNTPQMHSISPGVKEAFRRISAPVPYKRSSSIYDKFKTLGYIGWKFFSFYSNQRFFLITTILIAILAGLFIGQSFAVMLNKKERDKVDVNMLQGEKLTFEYFKRKTRLILHLDNSSEAVSIATAYALSEPHSTAEDVKHVTYTALAYSESLTDYLVTRALYSPQQYVYLFAYGLDVYKKGGSIIVDALYSPFHADRSAAARSLAKAYSALLRHYTGEYDATIQVTDAPLALDLTPWMSHAKAPPLYVLFTLILSVTHMTVLPSMEHGLIRHTQSHAFNFSPARYWFSLCFWDLILYWIMVMVISGTMISIVFLVAPAGRFEYLDLVVVPLTLIVYGMSCMPQAYLFSLGPRPQINMIFFVFINIIFGETTLLVKIFHGHALNIAMWFLMISPQYNMAMVIVKIKEIFLYNSECFAFSKDNLCTDKTLHKCCERCGILQPCFEKKYYFSFDDDGILKEICAMCMIAVVFMNILLLVEYRLCSRLWSYLLFKWKPSVNPDPHNFKRGVRKEIEEVLTKFKDLKTGNKHKIDTFGQYLLVQNLGLRKMGWYEVYNIFFGLGKGEALALSGLERHGRFELCKMLAGYWSATNGRLCCMSRYNMRTSPHKYASNISLCCDEHSLPPWMTVREGLMLIALLRGVPKKYAHREVTDYITLLELGDLQHTLISSIPMNAHTKLHFATAVVGAPPVLIIDECTAYQTFSTQRSMYFILYNLRKKGHALFLSGHNVESHIPITNRLAFLFDGTIYDIDTIDNLLLRYSNKGYTIVVHLKDEVDVMNMFRKYFSNFHVNDTSDVLINVQVYDVDLTWSEVFKKMEDLKHNNKVYSYIITAIPINYIYNNLLWNEKLTATRTTDLKDFAKNIFSHKITRPDPAILKELRTFEPRYDIVKLTELPWSVVFHTS